MRQLLYCFIFILSMTSCGKKAPTNDQLKDLCRNVGFEIKDTDTEEKKNEVFNKYAEKSELEYDLKKITPEQVDLLFTSAGILLENQLKGWLAPVLKERSKDNTTFAYYYWKYFPKSNGMIFSDEELNAFKNLIVKEDLSSVINENPKMAYDLLNGACSIKAENWIKFDIVNNIKSLLQYEINEEEASLPTNVFNTAFVSEISQKDKEEIRKQSLKLYEELDKKDIGLSVKRQIEKQISYLNSAFATNKLINNKAPKLNFLWINDGNEDNLDDFIGKVVLLDFWATKCGPCIKSFPEMAELQAYYNNKDVVILGVTSIMGYFVDKPNKCTVNTAGDPNKEISLMKPYMKNMGMTWRVAFTEEDVMNVEYGVLGIPHIAILDKKGNVRYNNVTESNEGKIKIIDNLLNE